MTDNPRDHIVTIQTSSGDEAATCEMTSEAAHDLFAWLTSYFEGVTITLEQVIPVVIERERRLLWRKDAGGGPNQHIADPRQSRDESATAPVHDVT